MAGVTQTVSQSSSGKDRVRVGGQGFTVFTFGGQPLAFCQQVAHTSPAPVGPGAVPIQPMDEDHPIQIIVPGAAGPGTLTLNLIELFGSKVWDRLGASHTGGNSVSAGGVVTGTSRLGTILDGAVDIVDIFLRMAAANPADCTVVKHVRPPRLAGAQISPYMDVFHNCMITNVLDGESIEVGTMEVIKQITVMYTHSTRT